MRWHVKALCERAAVREDCVLYANMPLEVVHSAKAAPAAAMPVLVGGECLVQNSSKFHKWVMSCFLRLGVGAAAREPCSATDEKRAQRMKNIFYYYYYYCFFASSLAFTRSLTKND